MREREGIDARMSIIITLTAHSREDSEAHCSPGRVEPEMLKLYCMGERTKLTEVKIRPVTDERIILR